MLLFSNLKKYLLESNIYFNHIDMTMVRIVKKVKNDVF